MEPDIRNKRRYFAYICPDCRQSVIAWRDLGTLAEGQNFIKCPCGKSELRVHFEPHRVRMMVPCAYCGRSHATICSPKAFVEQRALVFSCKESGLACCFVGEEGPVFAETARLEQALDKMGDDQSERGTFLDANIMEEVLGELKDIASRGGVRCSCGSRKWTFRPNYSSVDLMCTVCGGEMRLPAATADDVDDICCRETIVIHGRKPG